jgi:hypothetical protein
MADFVSVDKLSDIWPGQGKTVLVGDRKIAVFNVDTLFGSSSNLTRSSHIRNICVINLTYAGYEETI